MTLSLKIEGLDELQKKFTDLEREQLPFAIKNTINKAAFAVMRRGREEIFRAFKPFSTDWARDSWYVRRKATKKDFTAVVGWSDFLANKQGYAAEHYLQQHWKGGQRKNKAFENKLRQVGVLPAGYQTAIGEAAEDLGMIDAWGNIKASVIVSILSALGALSTSGSSANAAGRKQWSASKRASSLVYWAGKPGGNTPPGIWVLDENYRRGKDKDIRGRLRPVLIFIKQGTYRQRLQGLKSISEQTALATFNAEFKNQLAIAMRTAGKLADGATAEERKVDFMTRGGLK